MKPTKKVQDFVVQEVAGEDTLELVKYLKGKENVSEFIIAADLEKEINHTRNMLYRLLHSNLVTFNRKKDKQKGWYIYYWTFKEGNINHLYWDIKKRRLDSLKDRKHREQSTVFFSCPIGCIRLEFDKAVAFDYQCPECGEVLVQQDNSAIRKELDREIIELEAEIAQKPGLISSIKPVVKKKAAAKKAVKKTTKAPVIETVAKKTATKKKAVKRSSKK